MNSNSSSTKKKQSKHSKNESSYDNANGGLDTINEMSDQLTTIANVSAIAARFLVTLLCLSLTLSFRTALWLLVSGKPQLG
jgi:hypothetical protein